MAYDFNSLTKQADEASNRDKFYTDFEDVDPDKLHQISELTDWMRTKAKGSDVREIIAQLFERTWLENIKEGNANMEVSQARGSYPNLKSRLDNVDNKQQQTTAQLAEKANKDEVTNVMTPKGTIAYASLPKTGNSVGWYYYCPDGDGTHGAGNYVWNGTSWFFGGTGDEGYNLLKKDLAELLNIKKVNGLYNPDDGSFQSNYAWTACDTYLPVNAWVNISLNKYTTVIFYDKDKNFINGIQNLDDIPMTAITIPSGAVYFRYNYFNSNVSTFYFDNIVLNGFYGVENRLNDSLQKTNKMLSDVSEVNGFYDLDGRIRSESSWKRIDDYFPIVCVDSISLPKYATVIYYDKYHKFISSFQNMEETAVTELNPPKKAIFCRISCFRSYPYSYSLKNLGLGFSNSIIEEDEKQVEPKTVILDINGNGDYTDFVSALNACKSNDTLIIRSGEYIVTASNTDGPTVKCNIKAFDGAKIVCNYDGSSSDVVNKYSPLNMFKGNGSNITIDGLTIETQNTRYCVHDEMGGGAYKDYTHVFRNCHFIHKTEPNETWNYPRCIGGGLGKNGRVVIENCTFDGKDNSCVDYHSDWNQSQLEGEDCCVVIKDCYAPVNTFTASCHGSNTNVLNKMYVSNCVVSEEPHTVQQSGHALNNKMYQWNNKIYTE